MKKILLLDAENNTKTSAQILDLFSEYQYVYIVYAMLKTNFDMDMVVSLSYLIQQERLFIHKMSKPGKNSADLGLAYIAGTLVHTCAPDDEIHIMSADKMMLNIVCMLQANNIKAVQILPFESFKSDIPCQNKSLIENSKFYEINSKKKGDAKEIKALKDEEKDNDSISKMSTESIYQYLGLLIRRLDREEGTYKRTLLNHDSTECDAKIAILVYCRVLNMLLRASVPKTTNGFENVLKSHFNGSVEIAKLIAVLMARSKFLMIKDNKPKYTPKYNPSLIKAYLKKNNHEFIERTQV